MNKENLNEVIEAGKTLYIYCESDMCEYCQVSRLIDDAQIKLDVLNDDELWEEDYIPSSTRGDYGPSNPWDAPGMSIHNFI